ncbi:hemolysin family protein [Cellulosimicrobium arenosum]|uniref:HlyC/CorC family transporter n=1 Tax=Cellulosimicrobium arenosum TaxID=2708133 RepID=A0A927PG70_9MICO|nr:hemolysin family protein [Cellulosimicrobium arenosum]MBD8080401.1 HlyC/CorC family transporter [Cellulosimicrobium arenosum]
MDSGTWTNIALVLLFVLVGGVFAGTEIALVSLRESQVAQLAKQSPRGARVASVARDPNRFLAAVQIGVTVAGFFSAAYGASTLAPDLAPVLEGLGLSESLASTVALVLLTLVVAYLSLVLGELVPKRIALQRSAPVALAVAPPLDRFATLMRPVIWLLSRSTDAVVRLVGGDPSARSEEMSEDELRQLVLDHEDLPEDERQILGDVFEAGSRSLAEAMTPRADVAFLPAASSLADAAREVASGPYSRYPVTGEDFDDIIGFLHVRDLLGPEPWAEGAVGTAGPQEVRPRTVRDVVRPVLELPATNTVLPTMSRMRREGVHIAVVVDEYGGTDGIVTLEDLVEELVGDIRDEYDPHEPSAAREHAGATSVDAGQTIEEFARRTGVSLPDGPYETVAGFVIADLGRLAGVGDHVDVGDHRLTVTDVARRRIVRVDVTAVAAPDVGGDA